MPINFGRNMGETLSLLMSLLLNKVHVPTQFHERAKVVKEMTDSDSSGLVDSLVDFQISSACVNIKIDTESDKLNKILNEKWLANLNSEFRGKGIQRGIAGLQKEYFKERWKGASFPVLKITRWKEIDGLLLPVSMIFVNGGSIYAVDDNSDDSVSLFGYRYFLGKAMKEEIEGEAYLMYKCFCRSFDKYPVPYLIRRGIYKNWQIIDILKDKQIELVKQIIPYLFLIKEGSEALQLQKDEVVGEKELKQIKNKIQELLDRLNTANKETPMRVTSWAEKIEHLIPDLQSMFRNELFASSEKQILAGFGFIDVAQPISSRRDSFLNPRAFIKEVNEGVKDFKLILEDLISLIKEKNEDVEDVNHRKYNALKWIIVSKPVTDFNTDEFFTLIRSLSDRGRISNELEHEILGINHELEIRRREREVENEEEIIFYPKVITNQEQNLPNLQEELRLPPEKPKRKKQKTPEQETKDNLPDDKREEPEKQDYVQAEKKLKKGVKSKELVEAPYKGLADLPDYIKKLPVGKQKIWLKAFNYAWERFKHLPIKKREARCFKYANGVIKKIKKGTKSKTIKELLKSMKEEITEEILKEKKLSVISKQEKLLDKLLEKRE
jgi:cation transport regulator ChaB